MAPESSELQGRSTHVVLFGRAPAMRYRGQSDRRVSKVRSQIQSCPSEWKSTEASNRLWHRRASAISRATPLWSFCSTHMQIKSALERSSRSATCFPRSCSTRTAQNRYTFGSSALVIGGILKVTEIELSPMRELSPAFPLSSLRYSCDHRLPDRHNPQN